MGEESIPRDLPALKGRDEPFGAAEATVRGGQCLVISPLQGLLPENDGVSFATQAVGPGFVSSPLQGSKHSQPRINDAQSLKG